MYLFCWLILFSLATTGDVSSLSLWYYIFVVDSRNTLIMRLDLIFVFDGGCLLIVDVQPFTIIPSISIIRNRRFLTFYFLICVEPTIAPTIKGCWFLTFYFLICVELFNSYNAICTGFLAVYILIYIELDLQSYTYRIEFLTVYFPICIEPLMVLVLLNSKLLTFCFLICIEPGIKVI